MSATGMWVEKYRPMKLSEIVNQTEIIGSLEALIKDPTDMPHLMFSGSQFLNVLFLSCLFPW